jgi:hypothetical protein
MVYHFSTDPERVIAVIGPSISHKVYEVGHEVVVAFQHSFSDIHAFISPLQNGKSLLNLWEANRQVLISSGINSANIEISERCSYLEAGSFYSARSDGLQTGRIVSGIYLCKKP